MRKPVLSFLFSTFLSISLMANAPVSINTLNDYVKFTNESIHGMLIVHRLLELYNQDINKYVDLEAYDLNFFSNADLPRDIFEDPDQWFFDESPHTIYDRILKSTSKDKSKDIAQLNQYCKELRSICSKINKILSLIHI